jgi:hypothetical protein
MLKLIGLSTALSLAAIIGSLPQAVFSRPKPQASSYPVRRNVEVASPFCYMRTQRGVTLNLERLCRADDGSANGNTAANVTNNPAPTTNPNQANPNQATANGASRNGPTVINITAPAGTVTPAGTNTNANGASNGTNTNANGTSNGTNTSTNSNIGGANTGTSSNFGGTNSSANGTSNGTNTGTSSNFGGTNRNILQP